VVKFLFIKTKTIKVTIVINGKVIYGTAQFESVLNSDSNLDNYARINCYLYIPATDIVKPGLETLFIEHH